MINAFADIRYGRSRPTVDMSQGFRRSLCYLLLFDAIATEGAGFEGKSGSGFFKNKVKSNKKKKKATQNAPKSGGAQVSLCPLLAERRTAVCVGHRDTGTVLKFS